ncbi:MAG: hypothetical protein LUE11_11525 [Clostridia bacterium]|nr:hypothetical protein [Clostridia bacterium]
MIPGELKTNRKKIMFPRIANYNGVIRYFVEVCLEQEYIMPPKMTRHTLEVGARYSPDSVCTPFKSTLGSMIEALDIGADTLMMSHGLCRLGYYGELQEQILRDLGYEFDFINISEYSTGKKKDMLKVLKRINPKVKYTRFLTHAMDGVKLCEYIDEVTAEYYQNCGFDPSGRYQKAYNKFIMATEMVNSRAEIDQAYRKVKQTFQQTQLEKPLKPLRVGIVGEFFTVMDAFSNLDIEQTLADMGVEVHRWMNVTNRLLHYPGEKNMNAKINDLCTYEMGPTSTANIWAARDYARRGFDGIIHVKSAGCTPEIDIMPVLQAISAQEKIPVLYLTYDVQTGEAGLMTRLEAFYDMLAMRKDTI